MEERGMVNAEDETEEDDLDLESVIAELEAELDDEEGEEDIDMDEMDMDSDEEEMDMDEEDDEIIDLEELLSALSEDEDEEMEEADEDEEMDELAQENAKLTSELAEHREAVEILRSKLNEVNLLNAKLLYTTKLFRKYNLNNSQKMKVVESFDRTNSVRETKLIYSTLAESLGIGSQKSNNKRASITEGFASKPTTSTKPKQEIISESNEMADRFKRLVSYNK
jgi:predicted RNase H-like nuclease (RuvC/YqgF family)